MLRSRPIPSLASALLGALAASTLACHSIRTEVAVSAESPVQIRAAPARAWRVRCGEAELGEIVFYESATAPGDCVYVVRNPWSQDLGVIDALGRAYRYLPHHKEPAWVGTGTVAQGAERILQAEGPCALVEVAMPLDGERARLARPSPAASGGDLAGAAPRGEPAGTPRE